MGSCQKVVSYVLSITFILTALKYSIEGTMHYLDAAKVPVISVESTAVKAYNLTSDDRLLCIINLGVRVHNPNHKILHTLKYYHIGMEVRKGKHHALAGDGAWSFKQAPNSNDTVLDVEAVGVRVQLEEKIAAEVRADVAAGEGHVNVFFSGFLRKELEGYNMFAECKDVVVDFSRTTVKDQMVDCKVSAKSIW